MTPEQLAAQKELNKRAAVAELARRGIHPPTPIASPAPKKLPETGNPVLAASTAPPIYGGGIARKLSDITGGMLNQLFAAQQGTSPVTQGFSGKPNRARLGTIAQDDGGNPIIDLGNGRAVEFDPKKHVVLRDNDGFSVFGRTRATDEDAAASLGRVLGFGAVTSPVSRLASVAKPSAAKEAIKDFDAVGVQPRAATVGGRGAQGLENAVDQVPTTGGIVQTARTADLQALGNSAERMAGNLGATTGKDAAGNTARQGASNFVKRAEEVAVSHEIVISSPTKKTSFSQKSGVLYDRFFKNFADDEMISVGNAINSARGKFKQFSNTTLGAVFENPTLKNIGEVLENSNSGQLSLNDVKLLRTEIGKLINKPIIKQDMDVADLKRLYGGLTKDLESAANGKDVAARAGGSSSNALRDFQRANKYFKAGRTRIEGALSKLLKDGQSGENAFSAIMTLSKEQGAGASAAGLRAIKKSMPQDEFEEIAAVILRDMGKPTAASDSVTDAVSFSANTFVTNFNKLSKSAKNTLFAGSGRGGLWMQIEALSRVAERLKNAEKLTNHSNTARSAIPFFAGMGLLADATQIGTITALVSSPVAAKLMTTPAFVRWLAGTSGKSSIQLTSHLAKLYQIGRGDLGVQQAIGAFAKQVGQGNPAAPTVQQ